MMGSLRSITATLTALMLLEAPQAGFSQVSYFPERTFENQDFTVAWYSKLLKALREPSLLETSRSAKAHVYRFLWLRTFDSPIAVRLMIRENGSGSLLFRRTSGQGGYDPGRLIVNRSKELSREQVGWFLTLLDEQKFWELPTLETDPEMAHLDGAQWVLEGVKRGKYHIVDRWSPEKGPVRILAMRLIQFSGFRPYYDEVY